MIESVNISKRFKNGKGIFGLNFSVKEGEVFGFIGPNGAGKSTTIRHLMGFLRPDQGDMRIGKYNCWSESEKIKEKVGYLPGEIVFPTGLAAHEFLDLQGFLHRKQGKTQEKDLIDRFKLNINIPIKNMSKGMKQKLAIVSTFMCDPDIIILDEPSSGLDPLMQKELIDLLEEEKKKGKTIFLSSHIFEEIEVISDTICIIKDGKIVKYQSLKDVFGELKKYIVVRLDETDTQHEGGPFLKIPYQKTKEGFYRIPLDGNVNEIIQYLSLHKVCDISIEQSRLRDVFEDYYRGDAEDV